jgi:hypothetical protein
MIYEGANEVLELKIASGVLGIISKHTKSYLPS